MRIFRQKCKLALIACAAASSSTILAANLISNGSFEIVTPAVPANGICFSISGSPYATCTASSWTGVYQIGRGVTTGLGIGFNIPQPDPDGVQALVLQTTNFATQSFGAAESGIFALSFYVANRPNSPYDGPQFIDVLVDNGATLKQTLSNLAFPWTLKTFSFAAQSGTHTLTFKGLGNGARDVSAFIDAVSVSAVPEPTTSALLGLGFCGLIALSLRQSLRNKGAA